MALNYKWANLDDVLNAALENAPTGKICVLPDTTYVNITRVVNLVVNETKVDARSANDCPEPPNQAMSKEKVDAVAKATEARSKANDLEAKAKDAEAAAAAAPSDENRAAAAASARTLADKAAADAKALEDAAKLIK